MLVLSRKKGEVIHINDDIQITIVGIGDKVRIGIEAPRSTQVHRAEVYHAIKRQESQSLAGQRKVAVES